MFCALTKERPAFATVGRGGVMPKHLNFKLENKTRKLSHFSHEMKLGHARQAKESICKKIFSSQNKKVLQIH